MAQATLDPNLAREAAEAVAKYGSQVKAAAALGMSRGTLQHRLRASALLKTDNLVRPEFPSAHEPITEWLDRREADHRRRAAARDARQWMRLEIKDSLPFGMAFVGDPHIDDDGCDIGRLRADLRLIEDTPGLYGVGMGDWINNWQRKLGHLYGQQSSSESEAYRAAEWIIGLPIWLLLLKGNHDLWNASANPMRWMMTGGAPIEDWSADFIVTAGGAEWRVSAAHNFPGHSMWNKVHGVLRRAMMTGATADLYVAGDKHCWALLEDQDDQTQRSFWAARVRGYKVLDPYGSQLGYGSQNRGHSMVAVCDPADRSMMCFSDIERGARYLTLLRQARAAKPRVRVKAG